ncbi:hypothetical protein B0A50_05260 [Salinomyces thailandicus]|uniref:Uncharacterized protein n=1 Tax=Salinomyces thailandicus TaxID=706561 RepID=A0A4V6WJS0_9PEZI|nr:hypothetical protein B0A50_05260 [Salinomyces thailandica]
MSTWMSCFKFRQHQPSNKTSELTSSDGEVVSESWEPQNARLFHHYIHKLASWYDLSDATRSFAQRLPQDALSRPLIFHAVIAFAAIHLSRTTTPSLRTKAERHHTRCVQILITLTNDEVRALEGIALAAVCLLRSYEILAEELDPNRHLRGAYALAASQHIDFAAPSLARAGFFNYLREDITFSLITRQPLKLDSDSIASHYVAVTDEDQLNVVALHLARTVNVAFGGGLSVDGARAMDEQLESYYSALPEQFRPYCEADDLGGSLFPSIWMLADCHASVAHYYLVAKSVLAAYGLGEPSAKGELHQYARRLCGVALTSDSPAVLVNWFGPVAFCGRYLEGKSLQAELVRRIQSYRKETGWPVQRLIDNLQNHWNGQGGLSEP